MNQYLFITIIAVLHSALLLVGFYLISAALDKNNREKDYQIAALQKEDERKALQIQELQKTVNDWTYEYKELKGLYDDKSKMLDKYTMERAAKHMGLSNNDLLLKDE